ncbi:MAG: DUF480 domain-containing protein, partial [Thermoanaerobaculia bacterium]
LDGAARAVLTLLFLRGPQTPGELRSRSDRLHPFASLEPVEAALHTLASGLDPLVVELPRRAGQKENRWAHLLGSAPSDEARPERSTPAESLTGRLERLEALVEALTSELGELKRRLGEEE